MFPPDEPLEMPPPVPSWSHLLPWVWTRDLYEPTCELSDLGRRSFAPVIEYINILSEGCQLIESSSPPPSNSHRLHEMAPSPTATQTASERLEAILSNQYKRRMSKNRPRWYRGHPLDTAPKCFTSSRRNDVALISDWATCHRVATKKAAWMGRVFSHKYYEVNGVIWDWKDPARGLLVDLFYSDDMNTVEFAISSDPFQAPHVVVTHSPGEEPEYLDTHGNPDQLTSASTSIVPNPWGYTPRQSFTSPTGMDQLLLPPRMSMYYEREDYAQLCAAATINRRNIFLRVSIQFKEGLRRARIQRERGRDTGLKVICSNISTSDDHSEEADIEPATRDKVKTRGFSDTDVTESLRARGIVFQTRADDLALMAESAIVSEDSEDEDEDDYGSSILTSPRSPTIANDTYEVLCRLGMVHRDAEDGEEEREEDDDEDEDEDDEDEKEGDQSDEDEREDDELTRDITIPDIFGCMVTRNHLWGSTTPEHLSNSQYPDINSILYTEADEQSSVSSCFIDEDSFGSGSETPDTDEDDC